jgi:hypothetical protein
VYVGVGVCMCVGVGGMCVCVGSFPLGWDGLLYVHRGQRPGSTQWG